MKRLVLVLMLVACGGGTPSGANVTYFWNITNSTLEWGSLCSDDPKFRETAAPLAFDANSYFIYKVSEDGKKAVSQNCRQLDPSTCTASDGGVVMDIVGTELSFSDELRQPTKVGNCNLLDTQQWLLSHDEQTMSLSIADTMSLVDDQMSCDQIQADAQMRAPNGQGFQGCIVTWTLSGTRSLR